MGFLKLLLWLLLGRNLLRLLLNLLLLVYKRRTVGGVHRVLKTICHREMRETAQAARRREGEEREERKGGGDGGGRETRSRRAVADQILCLLELTSLIYYLFFHLFLFSFSIIISCILLYIALFAVEQWPSFAIIS
jgi:hypothetical protein